MLKHITVLGASAFALITATTAVAQDADTVVATVGDVEITLGEMIIARSQLPQQYQQFPPEILFNGLLDQLIQQQLLSNDLEDAPKRLELSILNERRNLMAAEVINEISEQVLTEEALLAAYEARYADAEPVLEWNASHLLVDTEEEAIAAKQRVEGGEVFADVAREVSTGPSGPSGGELGWFGTGRMVPAFESAAAALEVGEVSDPVQTQFGWHVIILNDTRELPPVTFEQAQGELANEIREAAIQARLAELEAQYDVVKPEAGAFDPNLLTNFDLLD
ncbi:peptidyl-prolyl cis-trans isomerase C [Cognatiyoonia sediminum]|uniref:Parvulin-like PPIase n=1 Tax=Cognatiyoonia sediminum TaxID=1508389 RepID=A0A1M5QLI5_9RHOB|nr:peptidylprolyl isomerase [Cognatiyoonia sediminum]SHH14590.1 peptidyl-prolyl cis-trans isomerase C [Cognatiyoonia sediminum]